MDLGIEREPVTSSDLKEIGYDETTMILEVEFHSGGVYRYFGVPPEKYDKLREAKSVGKTFHQEILSAKDFYEYREVQ